MFGVELTSFDFKAFINGFNNLPLPTDHLINLSNSFNYLANSIDLLGSFTRFLNSDFSIFSIFELVSSFFNAFIGLISLIYYACLILFDNVKYLATVLAYIILFILS